MRARGRRWCRWWPRAPPPLMGAGCCGGFGAREVDTSSQLRRSKWSPNASIRSVDITQMAASEEQLRLQREMENIMRLYADGLRCARTRCEAKLGQQPKIQDREAETKEFKSFSEALGERVPPLQLRSVLEDYRQTLAALDARLLRVERERDRERDRRPADWPRDAYAWERQWSRDRDRSSDRNWDRDREMHRDQAQSPDTFRSSRTACQEDDITGPFDVNDIIRMAHKNGLETLSYEQLVVLHEAVALAATHSPAGPHVAGDEEDEGASTVDADVDVKDIVADMDEGGSDAVTSTDAVDDRLRQDDVEATTGLRSPKDDDEKEDEVELKDEDESEVKYVVQTELPKEVRVEEEMARKNDMRAQHESDLSIRDEDSSGDEDDEDEGAKEGEHDEEFIAEGASEMPSTRPSISLSDVSSVPVEVTLRSACPLCPGGPTEDEDRALIDAAAAACRFDAEEGAVCAVRVEGTATISACAGAMDRLARGGVAAAGRTQWVGRVCGVSLDSRQCPLEGVVGQPMPPPQDVTPILQPLPEIEKSFTRDSEDEMQLEPTTL